ncbi:uncharacterized protein LOC110042456 isoform X1 [Orbicella faveolata]|uniref:uncharacterized protein LOC110042456 isoform X1 n=1 Tax=Orbicella faveolata TaxID=48498 RepID=UPI0009E1E7C9|nr:uncharacterized protein LOC110042456 isoform X1 [Orbicella faveolata]
MAALSVRCVRSVARASIQISKTALSTNGVSQTRSISSAVGKSILRDCGLLKTIARDNITRNLARRHTRLSAAVNQILFTSVVDIICEEEEGNGDDELTTELVTEEDEILTVCQTLRILWKICSKLCEAEGNLGF